MNIFVCPVCLVDHLGLRATVAMKFASDSDSQPASSSRPLPARSAAQVRRRGVHNECLCLCGQMLIQPLRPFGMLFFPGSENLQLSQLSLGGLCKVVWRPRIRPPSPGSLRFPRR